MEITGNDKHLERRQRDFEDLQHEQIGREVGKIARFLSDEDDRSPEAKRRKRAKEAEQRRLIELLTDPVYRAMYERLGDQLANAEIKADQTIQRYEAAIHDARMLLEEMEANTARGPQGQPVFRFADGRVVDAEGRDLAPEIAAGITWPENAPSAEEYFGAKEGLVLLENELNQWRGYRTDTLGSIRDRYDNEDDPMSLDDMEDALDRIETERPPMTSIETIAPAEARLSSAPSAFPTLN